MTFKKVTLLVLALTILVLVVACGPAETPAGPTATPAAPVAPGQSPSLPTATRPAAASPVVGAPTATPAAKGALAARVNNQPITMEEYQQQMAQAEAFFKQQGLDLNSAEGKETMAGVRLQVLEQLIDQVLIEQGAARLGISVPSQKVDATLQDIVTQMGGEAKFNEALKQQNLTRDQLRELLRQQLIGEALFEKVSASVPSMAEQVHARHILLATQQEAEQILARLKKGEDFAALARQYSQDPNGKESGGDLGWFPRGVMAPEFEQAAFSLGKNQLSGVVQTQFGFHLIQVLDKVASKEVPQDTLYALRQQAFMKWLGDERAKANIERFVQ